MAQAMASMTDLEGSLHLTGSIRLPNRLSKSRVSVNRRLEVRAQNGEDESIAQTGRRVALGLVAAGLVGGSFVSAVLADAKPIKLGPPPPPSGGLPGTENSDQARDFGLPLKTRFYLQPLPPTEAVARAKESAKDILNVKELIDKKAWPYVMNDLRSKASYLRYDLKTITDAKPKEEKKALKQLTDKLFNTISDLDHAAKVKSSEEAEKYYAATKSALDDVLAKLG